MYDDENSRFSLIENAQCILKKYSQVVLKKMEMKTKRYIETFKNISYTDEGQVTKVLLEVKLPRIILLGTYSQ